MICDNEFWAISLRSWLSECKLELHPFTKNNDGHLVVFDVGDNLSIVNIVPFRPEFFRPFFHYCLSNMSGLQRSLTLTLFPSTVQIKFH